MSLAEQFYQENLARCALAELDTHIAHIYRANYRDAQLVDPIVDKFGGTDAENDAFAEWNTVFLQRFKSQPMPVDVSAVQAVMMVNYLCRSPKAGYGKCEDLDYGPVTSGNLTLPMLYSMYVFYKVSAFCHDERYTLVTDRKEWFKDVGAMAI